MIIVIASELLKVGKRIGSFSKLSVVQGSQTLPIARIPNPAVKKINNKGIVRKEARGSSKLLFLFEVKKRASTRFERCSEARPATKGL